MAEPITGGQQGPHSPAPASTETERAADKTGQLGSLSVYLVTIETPRGRAELEVPTMLGPAAAERRAWMTAVQLRWGDLDQIAVISTELITGEPRR